MGRAGREVLEWVFLFLAFSIFFLCSEFRRDTAESGEVNARVGTIRYMAPEVLSKELNKTSFQVFFSNKFPR